MTKLVQGVLVILFIFLLQSLRPIKSQASPQPVVQLPEVLRRLSLPFHICTKTVDNLWECVSGSNPNSRINSIDTATVTPDADDRNELTTSSDAFAPTDTEFLVSDTTPMNRMGKEEGSWTTSASIPPCSPAASGDGNADVTIGVEIGNDSSEMSTTISDMASGEESKLKVSDKLIFEDNFNSFDLESWSHDLTMSGDGNWEFQIYVNNRSNSFVRNGMLHIKPTLTADVYGEEFLSNGLVSLNGGSPADQCTNAWAGGCEKVGNSTNILNPVMSAKLHTVYSLAFKYGRVEIRAKLPSGDWLRPAISLLPFRYNYGRFPASGEIHIMESRGNKDLKSSDGENIGSNQVTSSVEFGPFLSLNGKENAEFTMSSNTRFDEDFHIFELEWTADFMKFSIDGNETGKIEPTEQGFWKLGQFDNIYDNPWEFSESKMAPFDQKFYLAISLAVGGTTGYFPDDSIGPYNKPWSDLSSSAYKEFWDSRSDWLPSWTNSTFIIDYVRVYSAE